MKLRKNQARYKIPAHSCIHRVVLEGNQRHNQMCAFMIQIVPFEKLPKKPAGRPEFCAFSNYGMVIEFSPPPDKPYVVKIRYTPPAAEF